MLGVQRVMPVPELFTSYSARNGCGPGLDRAPVGNNATRVSARGCSKGVEVIQVHGSNHFWWYSPSAADEMWAFLMRNPKRVLSKAQILDRVWHYDFGGQANVVELYISYLRKKIDAGREPMIHTMRGAGYVLKPAG